MCIYESRPVTVGKGHTPPEICFQISGFTFPYHGRACDECSDMVGLVWWSGGLPMLTILVIWVEAGHVRPLPIITTAARATHNRTQHRGGGHSGQGYVGLEWWHTIRSGRHHGGRCRKDFSEKKFFGR